MPRQFRSRNVLKDILAKEKPLIIDIKGFVVIEVNPPVDKYLLKGLIAAETVSNRNLI